jgi:hypothetical protein
LHANTSYEGRNTCQEHKLFVWGSSSVDVLVLDGDPIICRSLVKRCLDKFLYK